MTFFITIGIIKNDNFLSVKHNPYDIFLGYLAYNN